MSGLYLDRYEGESIILNGNTEIKVIKTYTRNNKATVTLRINAPDDVAIWREEVQRKINQEKIKGANSNVFSERSDIDRASGE